VPLSALQAHVATSPLITLRIPAVTPSERIVFLTEKAGRGIASMSVTGTNIVGLT
jgi:hypothetical protein